MNPLCGFETHDADGEMEGGEGTDGIFGEGNSVGVFVGGGRGDVVFEGAEGVLKLGMGGGGREGDAEEMR